MLGENLDMGGGDSKNGCGKTSVLNALSYALYGWAISDIKKEHLINKSNGKNMLVTLEFESNGKSYKIVRGRRPNILEFYQDGVKRSDDTLEDSSQGDSRETQAEIERIIGMSQDMFCQIVAINTYSTPFLFQKINDQRTIIEQLLGITLLSEKANRLKEEMKTTKENIIREESRINGSKAANKRIQDQIESVQRKQVLWTRQKDSDLKTLTERIEFLSTIDIDEELDLHEEWDAYNTLESQISSTKQHKRQTEDLLAKEQKKLKKLHAELVSLENQCCHTCHQKIQSDIHASLLSDNKKELDRVTEEILRLETAIAGYVKELSEYPPLVEPDMPKYSTLQEVYDHKNKLDLVLQQYDSRSNEKDPYQDQILDMRNSALETIDLTKMNELTRFSEHQEFLLKLLVNKDSFIRKKIIDQNLYYLNTRLDHYLTALGLPHTIVFQNDLSVTISELGRELSPGNLSRGEMARLSLGLSFSFRDVYESLYQQINLYFIDEMLDSGLDVQGGQEAMKLLRDMTREQGKDVWLISHKEDLITKANVICKVIKENGYTTFSFEEQ